jgi:hypothetical protein
MLSKFFSALRRLFGGGGKAEQPTSHPNRRPRLLRPKRRRLPRPLRPRQLSFPLKKGR